MQSMIRWKHAYRTRKYLICKKENIKCNNTVKQYKMFNFKYITKEGIKEHNPNWQKNS